MFYKEKLKTAIEFVDLRISYFNSNENTYEKLNHDFIMSKVLKYEICIHQRLLSLFLKVW